MHTVNTSVGELLILSTGSSPVIKDEKKCLNSAQQWEQQMLVTVCNACIYWGVCSPLRATTSKKTTQPRGFLCPNFPTQACLKEGRGAQKEQQSSWMVCVFVKLLSPSTRDHDTIPNWDSGILFFHFAYPCAYILCLSLYFTIRSWRWTLCYSIIKIVCANN